MSVSAYIKDQRVQLFVGEHSKMKQELLPPHFNVFKATCDEALESWMSLSEIPLGKCDGGGNCDSDLLLSWLDPSLSLHAPAGEAGVRESRQYIIAAPSGFGKTTRLRWIRAELAVRNSRLIPILLEAESIPRTAEELSGALIRKMRVPANEPEHWPEEMALRQLGHWKNTGRILLLIDLDKQIEEDQLNALETLLSTSSWSKCAVVIAATPATIRFYDQMLLSDSDTKLLRLARLTDSQSEAQLGLSRAETLRELLGSSDLLRHPLVTHIAGRRFDWTDDVNLSTPERALSYVLSQFISFGFASDVSWRSGGEQGTVSSDRYHRLLATLAWEESFDKETSESGQLVGRIFNRLKAIDTDYADVNGRSLFNTDVDRLFNAGTVVERDQTSGELYWAHELFRQFYLKYWESKLCPKYESSTLTPAARRTLRENRDLATRLQGNADHYVRRDWLEKKIRNGAEAVSLIVGDPGSGKSAFIAEWANAGLERDVIAFHMCAADFDNLFNPGMMIRSLIGQFRQQFPQIDFDEIDLTDVDESPFPAWDALFGRSGLLQTLAFPEPKYVLIDSLDEALVGMARKGDGDSIVDLVERVLPGSPNSRCVLPDWLRIVATTRSDYMNILGRFKDYTEPYFLGEFTKQCNDDIFEYVDRRLGHLDGADSKSLAAIANASGGVFLYVFFICEEILRTRGWRRPISDIDNLPNGLSGYYQQYFERLGIIACVSEFRFQLRQHVPYLEKLSADIRATEFSTSKPTPEQRAFSTALYSELKPLLRVIAGQLEPLPEELVVSAAFAQWPEESRRDIYQLFRQLLDQFIVGTSQIRFSHKSIRDWLVSDTKSEFSLKATAGGHRLLAIALKAYFQPFQQLDDTDAAKKFRENFKVHHYLFENGAMHVVKSGEPMLVNYAVQLLAYVHEKLKLPSGVEAATISQLFDEEITQGKIDAAKALLEFLTEFVPEELLNDEVTLENLACCFDGVYCCETSRQILNQMVPRLFDNQGQLPQSFVDAMLNLQDFTVRHALGYSIGEFASSSPQYAGLYSADLAKPERDANQRHVGRVAIRRMLELNSAEYWSTYRQFLFPDHELDYVDTDATYDLLVNLAAAGEKIFDRLPSTEPIWSPVWDFRKVDVACCRALLQMGPGDALQQREAFGIKQAHWLIKRLLNADKLPGAVRRIVESFWTLGICMDTLHAEADGLGEFLSCATMNDIRRDFVRLIMLHPYWEVAEVVADLIVPICGSLGVAHSLVSDLLDDECWRVQYGAAEAAFLLRHRDKGELFFDAVMKLYDHSNPYVRGNCVENLTQYILSGNRSWQSNLVNKQETRFDVVLKTDGGNTDSVVNVVRAATCLEKKEVRKLVENTPIAVKQRVSKRDAEKLAEEIEGAGGSCEVVSVNGSSISFEIQLGAWLRDEDCWPLDHVHLLFNELDVEVRDVFFARERVESRLFAFNETELWNGSRDDFFTMLEQRKRQIMTEPKALEPEIHWCRRSTESEEAVQFFINHKTDEYISHGEIKCGRADRSRRWKSGLREVLGREFVDLCEWDPTREESSGLALCRLKGQLVAIMVIAKKRGEGGFCYADLEDLLVHRDYRRERLGRAMVRWAEDQLAEANVDSLFLESGLANDGAHEFFEEEGFRQVSIVMEKEVTPKRPQNTDAD